MNINRNTTTEGYEYCEVLGVKIIDVNIKEAVDASLALINSGGVRTVYTPNSLMLLEAVESRGFLSVLNSADMNLPDGQGVIWASKKYGSSLKEKVAGVDFAQALLQELNSRKGSLYIYGGNPESLEGAIAFCKRKFPQVRCDGCDGFSLEVKEVILRINKFSPDVVFVCLGSPKQELFIHNNKNRFLKGLFIGLGGTVDIMSGKTKRAPRFFVKHSLEWFWRLCREPKRLKNLPKLARYVVMIIKKKSS